MKQIFIITIFAVGLISCNNTPTMDQAATKVSEMAEQVKPDKLLRHVVLFKFQDSATDEHIKTVEDAFHALPSKIDAIHDYEWGTNNSPEGLNKGLTHCFFVTFLSEAEAE